MDDLQNGDVQPAESGSRSCVFSVASLFPVPGAIFLWTYVLLGSSGYGALAMGSLIAPFLLTSLLLTAVSAAIALWRHEPCTRLAKVVLCSSVLLSLLVLLVLLTPRQEESFTRPVPAGMFGTEIVPVDHERSDTFVRSVRVNGSDLGPASRGKPARPDHPFAHVYLPYSWRPGLTVNVAWERCNQLPFGHSAAQPGCRRIEKAVVVQKYEYEVDHAWLHILPRDNAQIIIDLLAPGEPGYPGPAPIEPGPNDLFKSPIQLLDHDPLDRLEGFSINGQSINAESGGFPLPYRWRPDLTVLAKWRRCTYAEPSLCRSIEKVVGVPKYQKPETPTWVHMMPGDQILLIKSVYTPADPNYPGPSREDQEAAFKEANERRRSRE